MRHVLIDSGVPSMRFEQTFPEPAALASSRTEVEKSQPGHSPVTSVSARVCPACGKKEFKRWPSGWDGHAFVCEGLSSTGHEARKAEYRRRYLNQGV